MRVGDQDGTIDEVCSRANRLCETVKASILSYQHHMHDTYRTWSMRKNLHPSQNSDGKIDTRPIPFNLPISENLKGSFIDTSRNRNIGAPILDDAAILDEQILMLAKNRILHDVSLGVKSSERTYVGTLSQVDWSW